MAANEPTVAAEPQMAPTTPGDDDAAAAAKQAALETEQDAELDR